MPAAIRLRVRATPQARSETLQRRIDGSLAARITAPPIDGRANRALIDLLAKALYLPRRDVSIEGGTRGRDKRVVVTTDKPSAVRAAVHRLEAAG